jgi:hypothetical protein
MTLFIKKLERKTFLKMKINNKKIGPTFNFILWSESHAACSIFFEQFSFGSTSERIGMKTIFGFILTRKLCVLWKEVE